ncbi:MAG: alanine--tRNA ligase [Lachnospiraceae bacterium]|nr:alanine--tRNA ligase [Lachnospiraceae bacterium]
MQKYGVNELRKMFLDYFEQKNGHLIMKSFSLVPHGDKSVLLINAGMTPLKPYFTGAEIPPRRRVATCQKCIRTGDIENVGKTARHGTFFEMLGNFSFGDYFKTEAIHWTWEFLTDVVGLDPDRLYPSVYLDDDEAYDIWHKEIGVPENRIYRFGKEDNFWEHGAGPCGPCSEVYYDRGEQYGCGKPDCAPGCDCDRYMEIWNNVFTQFENDGHGNYTTLSQKNIDTGMGLERLAVAVQEVDSMFDIDTIRALRDRICEIAGKTYKADHEDDVSIRVITDHIRSATFMISDGITPSNAERGYVLRRLIRRAARHGRRLGIKDAFLADLSRTVIETSKEGYPELEEKETFIHEVLAREEATFGRTIDQGLSILAGLENEMKESGASVLAGDKAFELYDTYGFPMDLTKDILEEKGYGIDEEAFAKCMQEQKERARAARKTQNYMGAAATVYDEIDNAVTSLFTGYDHLEDDGKILVLTTKVDEENYGEIVDALAEGDEGTVITDVTPFYATMGGQVGDKGMIFSGDNAFEVRETIQLRGGRVGHVGIVTNGVIRTGETAHLAVGQRRNDTAKNHSATHLLQKALKIVLGDHVEQKGSYVDPERLRFDFVHFKPMSAEEIAEVEKIVNDEIHAALAVKTDIMGIEEARKTGAMALFGEKYGDEVRVVSMGDFSIELCGGTHVKNTADIGMFKIVSESGIAAGVRRIEALSGRGVLDYYAGVEKNLNEVAAVLKTNPAECADRAAHLLAEIRSLHSEIESLKTKMAQNSLGSAGDSAREINGVKVLCTALEGADMNGLRTLSDELRAKLGESLIVLASSAEGKVNLVAAATDGAVKKGAHAGNLIKAIAQIVGGGGGGRPNMAQAGGKDASKIGEAIAKANEIAEKMLG